MATCAWAYGHGHGHGYGDWACACAWRAHAQSCACACAMCTVPGFMAPRTLPLSWWLACPLQAGGADVSVLHNVFKGEGAAADGARHAVRTPGRRCTPALVRRGRRRHRVCLARVKMTRRRARRARTPSAPFWRAKFNTPPLISVSVVISCLGHVRSFDPPTHNQGPYDTSLSVVRHKKPLLSAPVTKA